jgi:3-mercaptopyruvate sulfurtransferase SseA
VSFASLVLAIGLAEFGQAADEGYPQAKLLIEPAELAGQKAPKGLVVLDARPEADFQQGRIAAARWVDAPAWAKAFGDGKDAAGWAVRIGKLGIGPKATVVVYDNALSKDAARVWWILRFWGVGDVRLLNGGWKGWNAAGLPVEAAKPQSPAAVEFAATPAAQRQVLKDELLGAVASRRLQIVDARSEKEHCGLDALTNKRAGAIPDAKHLEWSDLLDKETQRFKGPAEIRRLFAAAGIDLKQPTAAHCQSGGRSSVMVFAMELMGAEKVRNYYAGWSEWGNADDTPIVVLKPGSAAPAAGSAGGFTFNERPGEWLDVLYGGRLVARYMYAFDKSSPQRVHETYKPYLHVFDAEGKAPITKGPGGQYTHHRGIFIGWNKLAAKGKSFDTWHMGNAKQVHQKFLVQEAKADRAVLASLVAWNDNDGQPLVEEQRTMELRPLPGGLLDVRFTTRLNSVRGDVQLNGDPEHAGCQFRPANEVVAAETTYVFPKEGAQPTKDLDYPWVGETFTLSGKRYSAVHMNHPANPKGTKYSAYRDYGRFGAFFVADLKAGQPLELKYRFLVFAGEMPEAAAVQKAWDEFAGAGPSPVPKLTISGGKNKAAKPNK